MMHSALVCIFSVLSVLETTESFTPLFVPQSHAVTPSLGRRVVVSPLFAEENGAVRKAKRSVFQKVDDAGMSLKPRALKAKEKVATLNNPRKKLRYRLQSCIYFSLFILYRAYRGIFVLLPAVFKQSYAKLEQAVESPFHDDDDAADVSDPKTGRVRVRTAVTVSLLATIVTASYMLSGAVRVVGSGLKSLTKTTSATKSFEAAADQMETNESKILNFTEKRKVNGDSGVAL